MLEEYAARNQANDPACYAAAYRALAVTDLAERLPEITAKTLVMTGEHDQGSTPRMARLMHERIEGPILRIPPVLRHSILVEARDVVAECCAISSPTEDRDTVRNLPRLSTKRASGYGGSRALGKAPKKHQPA